MSEIHPNVRDPETAPAAAMAAGDEASEPLKGNEKAARAVTGPVESSLAGRVVRGMAAGCAATAPMTLAIYAIEAALPREQRLPSLKEPALLSRKIFDAADVRDELERDEEEALIWIGHFAYGAACGAIYGAAAKPPVRHSLAAGALFGLAVWGASYAGWIPAVGLLRFPTQRPAGRVAEFVASHLVWGASTALALRMMERNS